MNRYNKRKKEDLRGRRLYSNWLHISTYIGANGIIKDFKGHKN